ncbi:MAG: hypothetical protein OEW19_04610 [Acidobacteriota bacterium]|nr:hypothetical protein [Acidobacteriota bacterium]
MTSPTVRSNGWLLASLLMTITLVGAASGRGPASSTTAAQPSQLPQVMRLKLDRAQAVLAALATEDYLALERSATELGALTKSAAWGVLKTPEYRRHSADFLRETENLAASARAGDLNGATLDYAAMTFRCVQCHRHVKGVRAAD